MAKAKERTGEGEQEQKGGQLARRDESPLVPAEVTDEPKPRAAFIAELKSVEEIPVEDSEFIIKKTHVVFRNVTPGVASEEGEDDETSEPTS